MGDLATTERSGGVWAKLFDSIDDALGASIDWRGDGGAGEYVESCLQIAAALDHRCERPHVVAAGVLVASRQVSPGWRGLATPGNVLDDWSTEAKLLCAEVWKHPEDPSPDASVLSDALLHPAGADSDATFDGFGTALDTVLELDGRPFLPLAQLRTKPSIFYTPEARSRLEARSHLNIWRRTTAH